MKKTEERIIDEQLSSKREEI